MTDNLSKADGELRENISQLLYNATYGEFDATMDELMRLVESHIQAKQLEARKSGISEVKEFAEREDRTNKIIGVEAKYNYLLMKIDQRLNELDSSIPIPGFENTMSDLDKLTVKDSRNE